MNRVFISYSRKDQEFAKQLADRLTTVGLDVWIDLEDIVSGSNWSQSIQEGLDKCELLVLILTPDSMASLNVADEWQYVKDKNKPIVPVLLRPTEVHYQLARLQYIDFNKNQFDTAFKQLYDELKRKGMTLGTLNSKSKPFSVSTQELIGGLLNPSGGSVPAATPTGASVSADNKTQPPPKIAGLDQGGAKPSRGIVPIAIGLGVVAVAIVVIGIALASQSNGQGTSTPIAAANTEVPTIAPTLTEVATESATQTAEPTAVIGNAVSYKVITQPYTDLGRFSANILSLYFSGNNRYVAVYSPPTTYVMRVKDIKLKPFAVLTGYPVAFSPQGTALVINNAPPSSTTKVYDLRGSNYLFNQSSRASLGISDDGKYIFATDYSTKTAFLLNFADGRVAVNDSGTAFRTDAGIGVAFASTSKIGLIASKNNDGWLLWDTQANTLSIVTPGNPIGISATGTVVIFNDPSGAYAMKNISTGNSVNLNLAHGAEGVNNFAFSQDGSLLVTTSDNGTAVVWDTATGKKLQTLVGHVAGVNAAAVTSDNQYVITGSSDGTARVWSIASGAAIEGFDGHDGAVLSIGCCGSDDSGEYMVTGGADGRAKIWSLDLP